MTEVPDIPTWSNDILSSAFSHFRFLIPSDLIFFPPLSFFSPFSSVLHFTRAALLFYSPLYDRGLFASRTLLSQLALLITFDLSFDTLADFRSPPWTLPTMFLVLPLSLVLLLFPPFLLNFSNFSPPSLRPSVLCHVLSWKRLPFFCSLQR